MSKQSIENRRHFLQQLSATLGAGTAASFLPQMLLSSKAAAAPQAKLGGPHRALVCVYLGGGNDSFNWLTPRDSQLTGSRYDRYRLARGGVFSGANASGLAHSFNDLLPISPSNMTENFGLHPACTDFSLTSGATTQNHLGIQSLFSAGKAAFVCNAGTLVRPLTRDQYNSGSARPAELFSHNNQTAQWQIGQSAINSQSQYGWGGRIISQVAPVNLPNGLSNTISAIGQTRFLLGDDVTPFQVASNGVNLLDNYATAGTSNFQAQRRAALNELLGDAYTQPFSKEYATIMRRSISVGEDLSTRLAAASGNVSTLFPPGSSLASQLQIVARLIKVSRDSLSAQRQVYYVSFGSFDLHNGMFEAGQPVATSGHGGLLTELNQAVGAFWAAMNEISAQDDVSLVTMSDFGRTLSSNGDGSDHAWGGNMMVMGGGVVGNKLYGTYPQMIINNNDNTLKDWSFSRGQYIPTTAVDQVAATLAKWMGVTDTNAMNTIFPNLDTFGVRDLGFMSA
jgi:uncharacterized protein (DUF1501 family)